MQAKENLHSGGGTSGFKIKPMNFLNGLTI